MSYIYHALTLFGLVSIFTLAIGISLDVSDFDNTSGGYTAPYSDYSGDPVNWWKMDRSPTGLVKRGYVINVHVNGSTGMISFEVFRHMFDFRPFSERALAVHKPREAFLAMGFDPDF